MELMSLNKYGEKFLSKGGGRPPSGLFKSKTAGAWIKEAADRPRPRRLFGDFWFEGEICLVFGDSNVGKSILSVQIADSISKGAGVVPLVIEAPAQPVVYFDFELSDMQFMLRYEEDNQFYRFSDNFIRCEIDASADTPPGYKSFEDYLTIEIERTMQLYGAKVAIIDNITALGTDLEKGKNALELMKTLQRIKKRNEYSLMILAHTPKRDQSQAITQRDLAGSSHLRNFTDSSFSIAIGKDKSRYLKQQKVRNVAERYGANNTVAFDIVKEQCFLQYSFARFAPERELLGSECADDTERIMRLHDAGSSVREIAEALGTYPMLVTRRIKSALAEREENDKMQKDFQNFVDSLDDSNTDKMPF